MKILALDTSTEACSAALLIHHQVVSRHDFQPNQQSKLILPMLDSLLNEAGCSLSALDAIAFGCGPGSFTGLRIAASVTQGIAMAHELPVIAVSSLQTMAQAAYQAWGVKHVLAAIDAHVQAFYYGVFVLNEQNNCMETVGSECLLSPKDWMAPAGTSWKLVGSGWRYFDIAAEVNYYPNAEAMLVLAEKMYHQKKWLSPEGAQPAYLHEFGQKV